MTRIRFIEPDQVVTPPGLAGDPSASFGIQTDRDDVESILGYYVDGELIEEHDVQHRRANVDFNVKRGLPLYVPVRKNLRRAERLLRNMSIVAEIQSAIALIRAGQIKALGVSTARRTTSLPEVATVAESGLPGYESILPFGMFAPAKTPPAIVEQLNRETVQALNRPDVKERLANAGTDTVASSPAELAATVKAEMTKWGKVIKDAGIRDE